MPFEERDLLRRTARDLAGVELRAPHLDRFQAYLDELCLWNRRMNLTGLRSRERIVVELIADSLVPVPHLPPNANLLDVGSGAGLPGIPISIVRPDIRADLLEPSAKRTAFLRQSVRLLGLSGVRVIRGRIEEEKIPLRPEGYDAVTPRAVAGLEQAIRMCAGHVAQGGLLVGFGGGNAASEVERASHSLAEAGLRLEDSVVYRLPGTPGERRTLLFRKAATS